MKPTAPTAGPERARPRHDPARPPDPQQAGHPHRNRRRPGRLRLNRRACPRDRPAADHNPPGSAVTGRRHPAHGDQQRARATARFTVGGRNGTINPLKLTSSQVESPTMPPSGQLISFRLLRRPGSTRRSTRTPTGSARSSPNSCPGCWARSEHLGVLVHPLPQPA